MSEKSDSWLGWLIIILVGAGVGIWYFGTDSGWIPHDEDSVITAQANWFVGETKDCSSYPLDTQSAKALNKSAGDAVYQVNCDEAPEHKVKITFYGRKEQPENALVSWKCTRKEDSFVCKQTGAVPVQNTQQQNNMRDLCDNPEHAMTISAVREYAKQKGISPSDAGSEVRQAGCGIVPDPSNR